MIVPLLFSLLASAQVPASDGWEGQPPLEATATMGTDGRYTLRLLPGMAWTAAEVSVSGGGSQDLGPSDGSAPVEVRGIRDGVGALKVELLAQTPDRRGVSWSFEVQPVVLPATRPPREEVLPAERQPRGRKGRKGRA